MHLVVLLAAGALVWQSCASNVNRNLRRMPNRLNMDKSFEANAIPTKGGMKKFVRILQRPATVVHQRGTPLELTCEAMGSPAPTIQWLRNDLPILQHDQQSTDIVAASPSSIARVNSTLIVKPSGHNAQQYACIVTSGGKTAVATTIVYSTGQNSDLSERHRLYPLRPRIVVSYKVLMDTMGSDVVLPCRAKGHPRPRLGWWDNNGHAVRDTDRMRVLRSGELLISGLQWADMGEFVCRARNRFGADAASTFVYPVAA